MTDYTIGPTTRAAMEDARAGRVERVDSVEALMADLNAEERETQKPSETAKQFGSSMVRALNSLGPRKK